MISQRPEKQVVLKSDDELRRIEKFLWVSYQRAQQKLNLPRPARDSNNQTNESYRMDVEFAYLLNEVTQGPQVMLQTSIGMCNQYIDDILMRVKALENLRSRKATN